MRLNTLIVVCATIAGAVPSASNGATLFDNGAVVEATADLRFNNLIHTTYDDFTLNRPGFSGDPVM